MTKFVSVCAALLMASVSSTVLADDWIAERLRGGVMQFEQGAWVALERGDVVPDGGRIRTSADGRVDLIRGAERIEIDVDTEIALQDTNGQQMTSVLQAYGSVTIEAERQNIQHFSVQTPVLAAVVKGTTFTVTFRNGVSQVNVREGVVQVQDRVHDMVVDVLRGQSAGVSEAEPLLVSGPGAARTTYVIDGQLVPAASRDAVLVNSGRVEVPAENVATGVVIAPEGGRGLGATVQAGAGGAAVGVAASGGNAVGVTAGVAAQVGNGASANANANAGEAASVSAGASVGNGASASAGASVGNQASVSAGANVGGGSAGASVGANVGGTGANVSVGSGGASVGVSGGRLLNGLGLRLGN